MVVERILQQVQKNRFWKDKKILFFMGLALIINIFTWLWIIFTFWGVDRPVALHYNILFGIDSIGNWRQLLILPLFGIAVIIIHFILCFYFYILRKKYLINLLIIFLLAIQFILILSVLLITNI